MTDLAVRSPEEQREADIQARLDAATPRPWTVAPRYSGDARILGPKVGKRERPVVTLDDDGGCSDPECCGGPSFHVEISDANAELIANAPSDLEWALSQVRTLRAEIQRVREALTWALAEPQGASASPWVAWTDTGTQTECYKCWGCDGEFVSRWPEWEKPTDATFPHRTGCKYVEAKSAALPTSEREGD